MFLETSIKNTMNPSRILFYEAMYHQGDLVPELRDFYNYFISGGKVLNKRKKKPTKKSKQPTKRKPQPLQSEQDKKIKSHRGEAFFDSVFPSVDTELSSLAMSPDPLDEEEDNEDAEEDAEEDEHSIHENDDEEEEEKSVHENDNEEEDEQSVHEDDEEEEEEKSVYEDDEEEEEEKSVHEDDEEEQSVHENDDEEDEEEKSVGVDKEETSKSPCARFEIEKGTMDTFKQKINECFNAKLQPPHSPQLTDQQNEEDETNETRIQQKMKALEQSIEKHHGRIRKHAHDENSV
jgi:hypothetical protein